MARKILTWSKLVIQKGLNGTPVNISLTPTFPSPASIKTNTLTNAFTAWNYMYRGHWQDSRAIYNEVEGLWNTGGIQMWQEFNSAAVGTRWYVYNPDLGINFALCFYKYSSVVIKYQSYVFGSYGTERQFSGYTQPSQGYGSMPYPNFSFGFIIDESTNEINIFSTRCYSDNSNIQHTWEVNTYSRWAEVASVLAIIFANNTPVPPASDEPYGDDTYNQSVGGDGGHDIESDTIAQSALPIAAATRSGMVTAYVPNWGEIQSVADALLDPNIFQVLAANVVKFSDVIIGLSVFPCAIPATDTGMVKANVIGINIGTGVVCHIADNQYVEIDCGSLTIDEFWGNCMDYNPYTKISIFLPFCGMYDLDADEVMGKTLAVSYRVDIFSGACLATIKIDGSVFYQFSGQCSAQIPISSVSFDGFMASMLEIGVATATGGTAVGAAGAAMSHAKFDYLTAKQSEQGSLFEDYKDARTNYNKVKERSGESIADTAASAVIGAKGFYSHAGAMSGSPGFLGVRTPFLIIKRPEQMIPGMYGKFHGFPTYTKATLSDLVGYTEVSDIRLNIPEATVDEIIECEQLLKGGVVI